MTPLNTPPKILRAVSLAMVMTLFFLRPAALGQTYSLHGLFACVGLTLVLALVFTRRSARIQAFAPTHLPWHVRTTFFLVALFWVYEAPLAMFGGRSNLEFVLKEFIQTLLVLGGYGWALSNPNFNRLFFRQLCTVVATIGWSAGVTLVLAALMGIDALHLTTLDVKGYTNETVDGITAGAVYFPFSMLYGRFTSESVELYRFSGFFREAGIYQAVGCFCLAYEAFHSQRRIVMLGLLIGIGAALSTLGIGLALGTMALVFLLRKRGKMGLRLFVFPIVIGSAIAAMLFTPGVGLLDKLVTHSTSISDRSEAMAESMSLIAGNPLGSGLFSETKENRGINLIAASAAIGVIGFLLQAIILSGWRLRTDRMSLQRMTACLPVLITALVSQPLAGAPMMYLLVLSAFPPQILESQRRPLWLRLKFRLRPY